MSSPTKDYNYTSILPIIVKWKKQLLFVSIAAIVLFSIASLLIENKYKATAILFPTSTNSISKALLSETSDSKQDILQFGEEEEVDQLLQILQSDNIRNAIVKQFDLTNHYKIDKDASDKQYQLFEEYDNNIKFKRTEFMSVKIEVLDKDPEMSAKIANAIIDLCDSTKHIIQKQRATKAFQLVEKQYLDFKAEMQQDEDSLNKLRLLGINDYESQSDRLNEAYGKAILDGKSAAITKLEEKIKILSKYGGAYVSIRDNFEHKRKQLAHLKSNLDEAKMDVDQDLPSKFVVNYAYKPEKKSYPIRWLIVFTGTISMILLSFMIILFIERLKKIS